MYGEGGNNYDFKNAWANEHGDSNEDYGYYGDENFFQKMIRTHGWVLNYITVVLVLMLVWSFIRFHQDGVKNWWGRRRAAARYKRAKKDDSLADAAEAGDNLSGAEEEPTFMETLKASFTKDRSSKCTVDLGSGAKTVTMDAQLGTLEKVSELPFLLQQACRYSGNGELAALSLVDLWLHDRARIQLTQPNGNSHVVGTQTTPIMIRRARSFRITILPQTTR